MVRVRVEKRTVEGKEQSRPIYYSCLTQPVKLELTECAETAAHKFQTSSNHHKERIQHFVKYLYPPSFVNPFLVRSLK